MTPRLTIAFPTYNHGKQLDACIRLVLQQIKGKNIEILISDNASTDDTKEIALSYCKRYDMIRYHRNERNLEFDGNCMQVYALAKGDYLWMLGDDYILPGAVESILSCLDEHPVFLYLNTCTLKNEKHMTLTKPRFPESDKILYQDRNQLLQKMGIFVTYVSSMVYNMTYVRELADLEQYDGTLLLLSHTAYLTMAHEGTYCVNLHNCVAARSNNTVRYDLYQVWIKNYGDLLLRTAPSCGFDKEIAAGQLHHDYDMTIYDFVRHFRVTNTNSSAWKKDGIQAYLSRYPDIVPKYREAMNMPVGKLRRQNALRRVQRIALRFIHKKRKQ